jgi:DNA-binding winged helix-turn-helix (wHTH) protein/Tfp pilus assembly protein PilF
VFTRGLRRFGEFELDPANHVLTKNGEVIKLAPQPFKILVLLMERPGTLVTRAALREAVWGGETIVDFEHGLNTCIRQIRHALGDDADGPRFIETVPRLGYRFTAEVTSIPETGPRPRRSRTVTVAAALLVGVVGGALIAGVSRRTAQQQTMKAGARELYLRGQLALEDPTPGGARTAIVMFEKALALDAGYAAAYAGVAQAYLVKPNSTPGVPPDVSISRAQLAVERALALDESLPEAHLAAAELHMTRHDWPAAGHEYQRAIDVAPNLSLARQRYGIWLSLQARFEDAIKQARLGESLDPLSIRARTTVADVLRHARRFDEAILQSQRALDINPNFGRAHAVLGHCYLAQGRLDAAIEEFGKSGNNSGNLGHAYAVAGRATEARRILQVLEERYATTAGGAGEIARVYVGLHEFDRAFEWLARSLDDGSGWTLKVAIVWDPLRSDPRFGELLRKSGLGG